MGLFDKFFGKKEEGKKPEMSATKGQATAGAVKDVVCGMHVDPKTAPAKSEYMGKTYYFCSPGCKKSFDANPAKFVK